MTSTASQPEKGSYTIKGWCAFRGYSTATFYKMKKNGVAPRVTQPPGAPPRITQEADHEWLERVNNLTGEAAAEVERISERRRGRALKAAAKAVVAPGHPANKHRDVA